jgi:prepilin-type N-terminal cleavage/methylation domain-containing protein
MQLRRNDLLLSKGFTLIEVIIVIAILAILAGAMAPLAGRAIDSSRQDETVRRQKLIYQAILGDPSSPGSGFLSDVGRLPATSLTELAVIGSLPAYAIQTCGVGMGWRGPYLLEGVDSTGRPLDGWGTPMDLVGGQIRSAGPDKSMSSAADNLLYPPNPIATNNINGSIVFSVMAMDNSSSQPTFVPAAGQAIVYYAQNGQMQSFSLTSTTGAYVCPATGLSLPQGIHAITVTGDPDGSGPQLALTRSITVYCPGGGTVHQVVALR